MTSRIVFRSELQIQYATDGRRGHVRPPVEVSWVVGSPPQQGDLSGQENLLLSIASTDVRPFLMLYPTGGTTMSVLWNGVDAVPVQSLFITTDNGYEVSDDGVITPLAVTNPTSGQYRFWRGERPADFGVYPGGEDTSITTIPDTEVF